MWWCKAEPNLAEQARDRLWENQLFPHSGAPFTWDLPLSCVPWLCAAPALSFGHWLQPTMVPAQLHGVRHPCDSAALVTSPEGHYSHGPALATSPSGHADILLSLWDYSSCAVPAAAGPQPTQGSCQWLSSVGHHAQPVCVSSWPMWEHKNPMSPRIVERSFLQLSFASFGTLGLSLSFLIKYGNDETQTYTYVYVITGCCISTEQTRRQAKKPPKTKTGKHLLLTLSDMLPFHLILAHISPLPVAGTLLLDWMSTRLSHILEQGHTAPAILGRPWLICTDRGQAMGGHPSPHGHVPGIHWKSFHTQKLVMAS